MSRGRCLAGLGSVVGGRRRRQGVNAFFQPLPQHRLPEEVGGRRSRCRQSRRQRHCQNIVRSGALASRGEVADGFPYGSLATCTVALRAFCMSMKHPTPMSTAAASDAATTGQSHAVLLRRRLYGVARRMPALPKATAARVGCGWARASTCSMPSRLPQVRRSIFLRAWHPQFLVQGRQGRFVVAGGPHCRKRPPVGRSVETIVRPKSGRQQFHAAPKRAMSTQRQPFGHR